MKVLLVNGSPHKNGCTDIALREAVGILEQEGITTEFLWLGNGPVRDCIGCGKCRQTPGACIFQDDITNELIQKAKESDGFLFGTPVYYSHPSGRIVSILDRAFYAGGSALV